MGIRAADILYYMIHYQELKAIIQWTTWHNPVHERDETKESESLKRCFHFLDQTSRSFSAVIKELHPELLVPVALFYLILRGLDTVEDDMTLSLEVKEPMLRSFHTYIEKEGWNFDGNGIGEKDRQLLVEFQNVTEEFRKVKPEYRKIIADITEKMGNGMADYANNAEHNTNGVNTVKEYDLYCHYVAGLVGEGLTGLFVESKLANPILLDRLELQESMGLFLQKTNIIRDVHEDWEDKRRFWPKEIWSKYVDNFDDLFEPKNIDKALNCSSEMVCNAMSHIDDCIYYLAGLKEQSVFNFSAIPQTMAIATLEVVFRNPNVFKKNVKITKGQACEIMGESTQNLRVATEVFKKYTRRIHHKNTPRDPNFLKVSIACGKVEQFIESIFPSQDAKALKERAAGQVAASQLKTAEQIAADKEAKHDMMMIALFVLGTLVLMSVAMIGMAYFLGARFDVAASQIKKGNFIKPDVGAAQEILRNYDRTDL